MKRVVVTVCMLGMLASFAMAATNEVSSVNVVGFSSLTIPPDGLVLVGMPFESMTNATLESIVGDQVGVGSIAFLWNRATSSYVPVNRTRAGWGLNEVLRGDAFWLKPYGSQTNVVTFSGEVPAAYNGAESTLLSLAGGIDAVSYAYPIDVVWTNTTLSASMAVGDYLFIWDVETQSYAGGIFNKTRGGWATPAGYIIPAGTAFWVQTASPIEWTEVVPYSL